ncbi:MAG TPA: endopeptidase La [Candidatus Aminicenantes bacterium]|nr:endopeptidase La [Candidatus Aminicenantes bacterium]HRY65153.1 endopeptidase La [Candidatus Aminicenantes bacterium]HRZ72379.1 endopeptidase La [Candidatus Aminicenantes bacterium]
MQDSNEHTEVLKNIPLIPLRDLVVFPATLVPFIVGRSSSIQALERAAEKDKMVFLAAQMDASVDNPSPKDIYSVGVTAKIIRTIKSDDRNMKVIVEGKSRARIVEYLSTYPYYQILAKAIREVDDHLPESRELLKRVLALFEDYLKLNQNANLDSIIPALRENTPERITDIIASHVYMPIEEKQNLLETVNSFERLRRLNYVLENEILKIHSAYQKDPNRAAGRRRGSFKDQAGGGQKPFPPGAPGGRKEDQPNEIEELRQKVAKAKMPPDGQEKAYKEIERLETMPPMSAEATVSRNYLDWLISLPWVKKTREKRELKEAERILNEDHHGLEKVKERILEYLSIRQLVKNPRGVILGLIGPPGVGKSSLAKSIARATGRKFVRLSLGGVRDEAEIRGHRRTYIGAYPGRIIQMIKRAGTKNPVFLLDEVDKMSMDFRGDPASALMEVLDPEQNSTFLDHYIDTDFDLSQVMFIVTANLIDPIPKPLIDRMEIIRIPGYTEDEKLEIAKRFLLPKQMEAHGLTEANIKFSDHALVKLIRGYTREAGVRNLEREITTVCRKVVKRVVEQGKEHKEHITPKNLESYLGIPKFRRSEFDKRDEIGVATGMAWTEFGGELLRFEATKVHGKGSFTLTGQLGEIMQESAQTAFSFVRGKIYELDIARDLHRNSDIHVHVPEGSTPKEGPSAGITIATAIISLLTDIPVRNKVALSGEITLKGKVLPVGGIKEKLLAAYREGIREAVLPLDNQPDLKDLPKVLKTGMNIHLVETMDEVLKIVLTRELPKKPAEGRETAPAEGERPAARPAEGGEAAKEPPLTN